MKRMILGFAALALALFAGACSDKRDDAPKGYRVGDLYNVDGVKGVVYKLTDEAGHHGLVVSLDETTAQWATEAAALVKVGAIDVEDGAKNQAAAMAVDDWQVKFPAFNWCASRNMAGRTGWFLPAFDQLTDIYDAYITSGPLLDEVLTSNGGVAFSTDEGSYYWSSSENLVSGKEGEAAFLNFNNDGIGFKDKPDVAHVRAVHVF